MIVTNQNIRSYMCLRSFKWLVSVVALMVLGKGPQYKILETLAQNSLLCYCCTYIRMYIYVAAMCLFEEMR